MSGDEEEKDDLKTYLKQEIANYKYQLINERKQKEEMQKNYEKKIDAMQNKIKSISTELLRFLSLPEIKEKDLKIAIVDILKKINE